MNRIALNLLLFGSLAGLQAQQSAPDKQLATAEQPASNALQPLERYRSPQMKLLVAGRSSAARVTIRDWEIRGRQKIAKFPELGTLIVHLKSGRITTSIGGRAENREPGD